MLNALLIGVPALAGGIAATRVYGNRRWEALTRRLHGRLEAARMPLARYSVDLAELDGLPEPVQRCLRAALRKGAPLVTGARARHMGTFNMGRRAARWKRFTSEQKIVTRRPGFAWDARIEMAPGVHLRAHDAYVAGEGWLQAAVYGAVPVLRLRGPGELAEGELMRFFAEAVWYPTALLPSQGVAWEPVDERSAYGVLEDGGTRLALLFTFSEKGLIETVRAQARGRAVDGGFEPTPWEGRFWNYAERGGMKVPLEGEVAWVLPEGPRPYWRGRLIDVSYEFAR
jgi:hypothetical protein